VFKKLIVLTISLALIFGFLIITKNDDVNSAKVYSSDHLDGSDFQVVKQAYFGQELDFDATEFTGSENKIKGYYWDFGDGNFAEGAKVQHSYDFENQYDLEYPLVYSVTVMAFDGFESVSTTKLIELYPSTYSFFLNKNELVDEIPSENREDVGTTSIFDAEVETLEYVLEESVTIPESEWILTLSLEKPILLKIKKISISLLDENSNEISKVEKNIGLLSYGRFKTIELKGTIDSEVEFKSIQISFYGFSIGENIEVLYGGEKASNLEFNFQN